MFITYIWNKWILSGTANFKISQWGVGPWTLSKSSSETKGFGFKSPLFRLHFQNHLTYSEVTLNAKFLFCFLPHGQTASCSYGGPDWFPSWPTTSWFPFEFHTKLCSWECPTSHLCPPPRRKLGLTLRPASFFGPFTFSALFTVWSHKILSCLTTSAFHLHSLCNMVWGCLCLWIVVFFFNSQVHFARRLKYLLYSSVLKLEVSIVF